MIPLLALATLLAFAGCGGCTRGDNTEPVETDASVLRIGTTMAIRQTNPVADYYYNILAMIMTHDTLVRFDEDLNPVPQLAVSFHCDGEGKLWTFELTPDARWHDGKPVTPEDVKFTFEYLEKNHTSGGWMGGLVETIETDRNRVVFRLKKPYSRFLINAGFGVRILPRHIWENIPDPYQTADPAVTVGCGPYRFDGFDRASAILKFRANEGYYGGSPKAEGVQYHTYGAMDILALALLKGQVELFYQYASGIPAPYAEKLLLEPHVTCLEAVSMGIPALLGFNLQSPLMENIEMRKAVAQAIDFVQMNASLMKGKGQIPSPGLVPPSFPFRTDLPPWSRNVEKSREILRAQGWSDPDGDGILKTSKGRSLTLSLLVRSDLWGENQMVTLLAHNLQEVGIRLKATSVDLSTWLAFLKKGDYDLVLFRTTPWGMMMHAGYGSGYFDSRKEGGVNLCRLNDPHFFALCDRILATTDTEQLMALYEELQIYYAENLPAVALCWGTSLFPYRNHWKGFQINQLEGGLANRFSWRRISVENTGERKE